MRKKGYLDLHSHILPGVDDGSKNMEMTKEMLKKMYEEGVRNVLATSHSYPNRKGRSVEELIELTKQVNQIAKEISPDLEVYTGQELFYRESLAQELDDKKVLTLAGTDYVLVEFHPKERFQKICEGVSKLMQHGYYPVIAHVERVETLIGNPEHMHELVKMSCYMQVNAGSLQGGFFDRRTRTVLKMIKEGYIHFIGSDCHNLDSRPPRMKACVDKLYKKISKSMVEDLLFENQRKFLQNEYL